MSQTPNYGFPLIGGSEVLEPAHYNQLAEFIDALPRAIGGWGYYADSRDTLSPIEVTANTDTEITMNALGTNLLQELPIGNDYPNGLVSNGRIQGRPGDSLLLTVIYQVRRAQSSGAYTLSDWFDIELQSTPQIFPRTRSLPGAGAQPITYTTSVYTAATWAANGGVLTVNASVDVEIYDYRLKIERTYRGLGTYALP